MLVVVSNQIVEAIVLAPDMEAAARGGASSKTVALGANVKTVTMDTGIVVESDWSDVVLTADATTAGGFTVASNELVFADAGEVTVSGAFMIRGDGSGGASRIYNDIRILQTDSGGTNKPALHAQASDYDKSAAYVAPPGTQTFSQGPADHIVSFNFPLAVVAGDRVKLQWRGYFQSNTNVTLYEAESGIFVRTGI